MGFQVEPERVGRRRSFMLAILVAVGGGAIVAFGLLSAADPSGPTTAAGTPGTSPSSGVVAAADSTATPSPADGPTSSPEGVDCHDMSQIECGWIVGAAIQALPEDLPPVDTVGAWGSLVCRDTLDCPPRRFLGYQPLGSAVVSFGPGQPQAWVNVLEATPGQGRGWIPTDFRAWVVRWRR